MQQSLAILLDVRLSYVWQFARDLSCKKVFLAFSGGIEMWHWTKTG